MSLSYYDKVAEFLEEIFKKEFPNGYANAHYSTNLSPCIYFSFGLIGDLDDVSNKIRHNDPMLHTFCLFIREGGDYEVRGSIGGLSVKTDNPYLCMETLKTKFRNFKGDEKTVIRRFTNSIKRLKKIVDENKDNIYNVEKIPARYL